MVIQQVMLRTPQGVVVHEQWMDPAKAVPVGTYECDLEIYQSDRRAAIGFANFRPLKQAA